MNAHVITILFLPLAGALTNGLLNLIARRLKIYPPNPVVTAVAMLASGMSFLLSLWLVFAKNGFLTTRLIDTGPLLTWISVGAFQVQFGFYIDALAMTLVLIITGIGSLIHLYSVGYMAKDPGYGRYFAYLNLFLFFMLLLVMSDNLITLFIGWEGVGLCSYLLIGFWYSDTEKASAGKKAFIVNRIGDFGFLLGIFLIYVSLANRLHSPGDSLLDFKVMQANLPYLAPHATAITILLFIGATGKSAQIPLYVWLPDAMAGPTPVSALIHAATMVTAGVYMTSRMFFLFELAPQTLSLIAGIGAVTAFVAASIGLVQNDIKKILAYSTVSQLGYMFLGVGVGVPAAAVFHLFTHAFFKACLFLGAGSVIHALDAEHDIQKMGGLRKALPWTFATFFISTLAIAGIPPFSGFFSKDEILWQTWAHGHPVLYGLAFLTAGLTAFYMFRLTTLTFFGKPRMSDEKRAHLHESPATMTLPLVVLALFALGVGFLARPAALGGQNLFHHWINLPELDTLHAHDFSEERLFAVLSTTWVGLASLFALFIYLKKPEWPQQWARQAQGVYSLLLDKYRVDELYDRVIVKPLYALSLRVLKPSDLKIVDGMLVGAWPGMAQKLSTTLSALQSGNVATVLFYFLIGFFMLAAMLARG